jgi:hypothetical protein
MKPLFLLTCLCSFLLSAGQDTLTIRHRPGYKKWTDFATVPRVGAGIQNTAYVELGLARHRFCFNDLGVASSAYYAAIEWTPIKNIYGIKGGYEMNARTAALGLEVKYQTSLLIHDIVLTPRIGLGGAGIVNVFYGFNISFFKLPFPAIGRHQFSVVFNYNKLAFSKGGHQDKGRNGKND